MYYLTFVINTIGSKDILNFWRKLNQNENYKLSKPPIDSKNCKFTNQILY